MPDGSRYEPTFGRVRNERAYTDEAESRVGLETTVRCDYNSRSQESRGRTMSSIGLRCCSARSGSSILAQPLFRPSGRMNDPRACSEHRTLRHLWYSECTSTALLTQLLHECNHIHLRSACNYHIQHLDAGKGALCPRLYTTPTNHLIRMTPNLEYVYLMQLTS